MFFLSSLFLHKWIAIVLDVATFPLKDHNLVIGLKRRMDVGECQLFCMDMERPWIH